MAKLLSVANMRLDTPLTSPVAALPEEVLKELEDKGAVIDILRIMALVLPPRERVWWACLAARDIIGPMDEGKEPEPLLASEAWVFKPSEENRERARVSLDDAYIDDDTVNCAYSVIYCDGTLGPKDLAQYPAPAGAAETFAFVMNAVALDKNHARLDTYSQLLIDRAIDIGRGGNGRIMPDDGAEETAQ